MSMAHVCIPASIMCVFLSRKGRAHTPKLAPTRINSSLVPHLIFSKEQCQIISLVSSQFFLVLLKTISLFFLTIRRSLSVRSKQIFREVNNILRLNNLFSLVTEINFLDLRGCHLLAYYGTRNINTNNNNENLTH